MDNDETLKLMRELHAQQRITEMVCAVLIAELALSTNDPFGKITTILSGLQGVVHGAALEYKGTEATAVAQVMTSSIERISDAVERLLPTPKDK